MQLGQVLIKLKYKSEQSLQLQAIILIGLKELMKLMQLIKIIKNNICLIIDHSLLNQKKESIKNKRSKKNRKSIKNKKSIGGRDQGQNLNQYNIKNKERKIIKDHALEIKSKRKETTQDQKIKKINPLNGIEIDSL